MKHHIRPSGLPPVNGFSHCVVAQGNIVHVSGQVPLDADGNLVGEGDAKAQAEQVFNNLTAALQAGGACLSDVVKMTYFLTDMRHLHDLREVRDKYISADAPPASSLVQVSALVNPAFLIEVDAVAVV
ncbi:RidA family protein [Kribbella catacumbae]|uniref:RidA family protein n=1 Tax=Kribbella catacumbae TaxID=460086 RepID=UPI00036EE950|nr:RidA family protein [Kribbella catacumbae]